jgi:HK97 family phage prohead protease
MDAPKFPDGVQEVRMSRGELETDGRTLAGYLSVFDSPAMINERGGRFVERMKPGSFKKTINERGADRVKVMFDHGLRDMKLPIGKMQVLREDNVGLYFEARLSDIPFNNETLIPLIQDRAIEGTSFQGIFTKDEWRPAKRDGLRERDVYEVALTEGGPVTWPAYQATSIGLRSAYDGLIFEPSVWQSLTEDQRAEIAGIIRSATDIRTLDFEAGEDHFEDGAATEPSALEPQVQHSDGTRIQRHDALEAVALLRSLNK